MSNLYNQTVIDVNNLIEGYYIDTKVLFLYLFHSLPSVAYIDKLEGEKAFTAFETNFKESIAQVHSYDVYDKKKKCYSYNEKVVILKSNCVIDFDSHSCEILHDGQQEILIKDITSLVNQFKGRQRRKPLEINLIIQNRSELELKAMEIKKTKLDLDLFYEDDFAKTDAIIKSRLNKNNDKGIVLLHGLPGSGKTSYLRYLVGKIKKKVLFLSPSVAGNLMNPDFIELLISNPNSVLIIEDAENIIMDRKQSASSAVSNLLNISDGLLADFLNVQLICTFNSSLTLIDSALMRKGRLIAKYEFGKLSVAKAQRLSNHFGFKTLINKPMTIAEISNQHEEEFRGVKMESIGFRSQLMES